MAIAAQVPGPEEEGALGVAVRGPRLGTGLLGRALAVLEGEHATLRICGLERADQQHFLGLGLAHPDTVPGAIHSRTHAHEGPRLGGPGVKVGRRSYRTIWVEKGQTLFALDQTRLPHAFEIVRIETLPEMADAIRRLVVRGAPLIGVAAAYGLALGLRERASDAGLDHAVEALRATRPTAVNLAAALEDVALRVRPLPPEARATAAWVRAGELADLDVAANTALGRHGAREIRAALEAKGGFGPVHVLTHCNAGWLATVDVGTALAPIYLAHDAGVPVHVFVDETRPRNQGARLTAWELAQHGVPCTVIADNAGGHLLQRARVDLCVVGADRVTMAGDVANKVGTYLKALAAKAHGIPFYVAVPSSTIDPRLVDGVRDIPIEERGAREVTHIEGRLEDGRVVEVEVTPAGARAENPAFDVTPASLVTALWTERGSCPASRAGILGLFPELAPAPGSMRSRA